MRPLRCLALAAISLWLATAAVSAQVATFNTAVQPAVPSNELLVSQIRGAMPISDLTVMTDRAGATIATARRLEQLLNAALPLAPDDAARSRVAGVLQHTRAALTALELATDETSADAARGRLEQARGEAQEGLDELRPFVMALPTELPAAGDVNPVELAFLPLLAVACTLLGLILRSTARRRTG